MDANTAALIAALKTLIDLHQDWEPGGRATARFCDRNREAIQYAKEAIHKASNSKP